MRLALLAMLVALTGCPYDNSLLSAITAVFDGLPNHTCYGPVAPDGDHGTVRQYDWPCGFIATSVCRDNNLTPRSSGTMRWTVPDANGNCIQQPKCVWQGLQNTPYLDAEDCINRWRNDTFATAGCYEGLGGEVECPGYPK